MYIDVDMIIKAASLVTALGVLIGVVVAIYRVLELDRRQSEVIKEIQEEQTVLCYGVKGALNGLIELGSDGPCKEALNLLDKHLNKNAHKPGL